MPSLESVLDTWWGPAPQGTWYTGIEWFASNIITGTNPPFTATDFLAQYPNFGGIPTIMPGVTTTNNSNVLSGLVVPAGINLAPGQLVTGPGIPGGAVITGSPTEVTTTQATLSTLATASGSPTITFYAASAQLVNCETTLNSSVINGFVTPAGVTLAVGQQVSGAFIPAGSTITSVVSSTEIIISSPATFSGATTVTVYSPLVAVSGNTTAGSAVITGINLPGGVTLAPGQLVSGIGIPASSIVSSVATTTSASITMSGLATASGTITLTAYAGSFVPLTIINLYIQFAQACIFQARYFELWPMAMALFVNHFCTLWLISQGQPASTEGQAAAAALQMGVLISKSVDGVSGSYANPMASDVDFAQQYGSFTQTPAGQQLITLALGIPKFSYVY